MMDQFQEMMEDKKLGSNDHEMIVSELFRASDLPAQVYLRKYVQS